MKAFRKAWRTLSIQQTRSVSGRCRGLGNKGVASEMGVSQQTIKNHVTVALRKMIDAGVIEENAAGMDRLCWHLGYEAALQDIEQRLHKVQEAA